MELQEVRLVSSIIFGAAITELKGHEPKLYVATGFNAGFFFISIIIELKGPNKTLNH